MALSDGYFLTSLPNVASSGVLPAGDFALAARDGTGNGIGTLDLNGLLSQAEPR